MCRQPVRTLHDASQLTHTCTCTTSPPPQEAKEQAKKEKEEKKVAEAKAKAEAAAAKATAAAKDAAAGVSDAAAKAQARVTDLQERLAYKEYRAGLYYFRLRAYDSAIIYFRDLVATYPRATTAPTALVKLVEAYRRIGYAEEVKETCGYMRKFHPDAEGVVEACRDVPAAG